MEVLVRFMSKELFWQNFPKVSPHRVYDFPFPNPSAPRERTSSLGAVRLHWLYEQ